jgi:hypothetical protein
MGAFTAINAALDTVAKLDLSAWTPGICYTWRL